MKIEEGESEARELKERCENALDLIESEKMGSKYNQLIEKLEGVLDSNVQILGKLKEENSCKVGITKTLGGLGSEDKERYLELLS